MQNLACTSEKRSAFLVFTLSWHPLLNRPSTPSLLSTFSPYRGGLPITLSFLICLIADTEYEQMTNSAITLSYECFTDFSRIRNTFRTVQFSDVRKYVVPTYEIRFSVSLFENWKGHIRRFLTSIGNSERRIPFSFLPLSPFSYASLSAWITVPSRSH